MKKITLLIILIFINYLLFSGNISISDKFNTKLSNNYYNNLQEVYNKAKNGEVIRVRSLELGVKSFEEQSRARKLLVNRNVNITIEGGYDKDFNKIIGKSVIYVEYRTQNPINGRITFKNVILVNNKELTDLIINESERDNEDFISRAKSYLVAVNKEIFALLLCDSFINNLEIQKLYLSVNKNILRYRFDFVRDNDLKSSKFRVQSLKFG